MDRRKFLIGMGSLAAGTAAATGTGAFTSVSADRGVSVSVADDASAFLAIEAKDTPNGNEYVDVNADGTVSLDFTNTDESITGDGGDGLNKDATTVIDDLLKITNQGTQEVIVGYRSDASPGGNFALYEEDPDHGNSPNDGQLNIDTAGSTDQLPRLAAGETLDNIGAFFYGDVGVSAINDAQITFVAADEVEDL